ncbi:uncharacterized protein LY89DRAFT_691656 [Mollisia scopiformis]|uniref:Uncharacterized protein n=1 Tax=Mollisia scopiformis TaxID=149040 RepID=A0A132B6D7_MOLSC|nr:uncharacterized protein LY89DRAFT_691656 [Mollisia scopiformis]KUJ07569.1 hypothetical protein LY89DRAFT_691656 [Mollisia scopiformis]
MRLNTSTSLFVASSLFCLGSSLPFFPRSVALEPRATYSVVPVDGGSAATTDSAGQGEVTIVKTIVQSPTPTTQTVIETDTLPPTTDIIISTQTVEGSKTTQTVDVTLTPSATPVTVTATEYSVIDISAPTTIVLPPTATPSQLSTGGSKTATSNTNTIPETTPSPIKSTSSTADSTTPASPPSSSTLETSYTSTFTTPTSPASVSAASYDNGQWHTTYPTWSNGTATLRTAATPLQTTPPFSRDLSGSEESGVLTAVLRFFRRFSSGIL